MVPIERFHVKYRRGRPDECWEWTASLDGRGYGQIRDPAINGPIRAHRLAYELAKGPIPQGMNVLHSCDNPKCVNPSHLSLGTQRENLRDAYQRKRRVALRGSRVLTPEQMKDVLSHRISSRAFARLYSVGKSTIAKVWDRERRGLPNLP
jgi:hypothetical protein